MSAESAAHYDRVTAGWRLLFGEHLHFGLFAPGETGASLLGRAAERLVDRLASAAGLTADDTVLDVGCGTGAPALRIAEKAGCRVIAVTNSRVGAAAARHGAASSGLAARVQVLEADALATHLPRGSVSVAWLMESTHLFTEKAALFHEMARVMAPGARLVLCDITDGPERARRPSPEDVAALRMMRRVFGPLRVSSLRQYEGLLHAAGFANVATEDVTRDTLATLPAWRQSLAANRAALAELWTEAEIRDFADCSRDIEKSMASGRIGYGIVSATRR